MTITLNYGGTEYLIKSDGANYTLIKIGINGAKGSANFGNPTEIEMGYFTNVAQCVKKIMRTLAGNSEETLTLQQYVQRMEEASGFLAKQLNSIDF
jgi:hypothetical protein